MPDSFVPTIAVLTALAVGFSVQGSSGRAVELVLVGAAAVVAYTARWRAGRLVAPGAALIYLALEAHYHRLGQDRYWQELLYVTAVLAAVLSSAYVRYARERREAGLEQAVAQIEEIAAQSALTDLLAGTRRLTTIEYELERSRRHSHSFSLLLVHPDGIDATVGRWGEEAGAAVTRQLAELIGNQVRATDVPFPYGAFDFCVILPETPPSGARVAAERIRLGATGCPLEVGPGALVELSLSIGVASFPGDATTNAELSRAAGRALARAAELGGNRTVLHRAPDEAPQSWGIGRPTAGAGLPET